jgi:two-component system response regulator NreC
MAAGAYYFLHRTPSAIDSVAAPHAPSRTWVLAADLEGYIWKPGGPVLYFGRKSMPMRVVLADDHAMIRQGLKAILEADGFQVVGEAANGSEAVGLCQKVRPDVAVLDISMPLLNGLDAAREILKTRPQTKIILLTAHTQERYVVESLRQGVTGYLLKENAADELVQAVRAVGGGAIYVTSGVSRSVLQAFSVKAADSDELLTPRERQLLQLIAEGKSMKEIGALLGVSSRTADSHRTKIMSKLGLHDTASLVRYAIRAGLVSPETA